METKRLEQYQKLTRFQKDLISALIELGFKYKYFTTYELIGWGDIDVDNFKRWPDVLKYVHQQGKDQKRFEFQRVLGL